MRAGGQEMRNRESPLEVRMKEKNCIELWPYRAALFIFPFAS